MDISVATVNRRMSLISACISHAMENDWCTTNPARIMALSEKETARTNPPIYLGGHAKIAVERAARLGDEYLISTTQKLGEIPALVQTYHDALGACGKILRQPTLNRIVCCGLRRQEKTS